MAQTRGDVSADKDMIRHMVLNSIRGYMLKFKNEYGSDVVLACDSANPWRRDIFPLYKYKRRQGRDESDTDWTNIFNIISEIKNELRDNFPYKVIEVDKSEADDIIATLVQEFNEKEKIMIVSGDKDFIQLQKFKGVKQYAPIQKKFIGEDEDPIKFLREQIIKGDRSDGIPNILSADDVFKEGIKQKPITKARLEEWSSVEKIPLGTKLEEYYNRNIKLIDLEQIPALIYNTIISNYKNYKVNDRSLLLNYFIENKLKSLMENLSDF